MSQMPPSITATPRLPKPGKVQAIAIMCLVDGILNILIGCSVSLILICGIVTICCIPIGIYPIVVGIFEIIYATKILPDPIRAFKPAQYLAVMQLVNFICAGIISLVVGILSLVFYSDAEVKAYFAAVGQQSPNA